MSKTVINDREATINLTAEEHERAKHIASQWVRSVNIESDSWGVVCMASLRAVLAAFQAVSDSPEESIIATLKSLLAKKGN